ncbi:cytochrome c [Geomonas paludis]|uniref:Cytochrome c n=1 Tax=Geomonas paludis TaxID=2740185 RepID=A0A6V8MSA6_9BACT|nr:cytochrome c [Geomonas paludis]UPU35793.1 cytochrome c [Geomonas paludis]GFO62627.1 hypothetical protein GMPD_05460 [Geomonas paludis]
MAKSVGKIVVVTAVVLIVLVLVAASIMIFSGAVNVAATKPHAKLTEWVLETAREHSVERRAGGIVEQNVAPTGATARHFEETCRLCHGAPGQEPSAIGKGELPEPPDLKKVARRMKQRELFWVVKHGIKMTGMPAFGKTHTDKELWEMVSFVGKLPGMSQEQYRQLRGK